MLIIFLSCLNVINPDRSLPEAVAVPVVAAWATVRMKMILRHLHNRHSAQTRRANHPPK
jgi:hypothetical protein